MAFSQDAVRRQALLLLGCTMAFTVSTSAEEIPLWPEGEVPIPEANRGAKVPGPEQIEARSTQGKRDRWVTGTRVPNLTVEFPAESDQVGSAVVICPGGGYGGLAFDKEGLNVGKWCAERGMAAFTLKYRHGGGAHGHPVPLMDVQRALRIVRSRADQWQLDADRIGVCGFSAGGHVAACAATLFDKGQPDSADAIDRQSCRPHFAILVYPVISMELKVTHAGSRRNLLGSRRDKQLIERLSLDTQVTTDTPPTFLVHAADDGAVPIENSLRLFNALRSNGVPAAFHAYEKGGHGFGMLKRDLPIDNWPSVLEAWLKGRDLIR